MVYVICIHSRNNIQSYFFLILKAYVSFISIMDLYNWVFTLLFVYFSHLLGLGRESDNLSSEVCLEFINVTLIPVCPGVFVRSLV